MTDHRSQFYNLAAIFDRYYFKLAAYEAMPPEATAFIIDAGSFPGSMVDRWHQILEKAQGPDSRGVTSLRNRNDANYRLRFFSNTVALAQWCRVVPTNLDPVFLAWHRDAVLPSLALGSSALAGRWNTTTDRPPKSSPHELFLALQTADETCYLTNDVLRLRRVHLDDQAGKSEMRELLRRALNRVRDPESVISAVSRTDDGEDYQVIRGTLRLIEFASETIQSREQWENPEVIQTLHVRFGTLFGETTRFADWLRAFLNHLGTDRSFRALMDRAAVPQGLGREIDMSFRAIDVLYDFPDDVDERARAYFRPLEPV